MAERGVAGGNSSCLGLWYQQRLLGPDCFVEVSCGSVRLVRPAGLVGPVCRSGSAATWSLLLASAFFARVCGGRALVWLWALPAAPYGVWHPSSIQAHGARMDGGASAYGFRHTSNQFGCSMADPSWRSLCGVSDWGTKRALFATRRRERGRCVLPD